MVKISPSILAADLAELATQVRLIEQAGADSLHLDVMDGHFVPNITFGATLIKAIRPHCKLPFLAHLMIENAEVCLEQFVKAGCDAIVLHLEAVKHIYKALQSIRAMGKKTGVALNPGTAITNIKPILPMIDYILIMTVNPGFCGQEFITSQLKKVAAAKEMVNGMPIEIIVDGGVTCENAKLICLSGADILVSGNAIFKGGDIEGNINQLRNSSY